MHTTITTINRGSGIMAILVPGFESVREFEIPDECNYVLNLLGITISEPTKGDRDVALQLLQLLHRLLRDNNRHIVNAFKFEMSNRCQGIKILQNKLAELLNDIPIERFFEVSKLMPKIEISDKCKYVLNLFGITCTEPTKEDRDVALQLSRRLSHDDFCRVPSYTIYIFKKEMSERCTRKKKHQNNLAALLIDIPNERFLEAREQLLTAMTDRLY
jgi:hypothetical protein